MERRDERNIHVISFFFVFISNTFQQNNTMLAMSLRVDLSLNVVTFVKRQSNVGNVNPFLFLYIRSAIRPVSEIS